MAILHDLTDLVRRVTAHQVSGVLMDLGTSALQLSDPAYGMSFMHNHRWTCGFRQSWQLRPKTW